MKKKGVRSQVYHAEPLFLDDQFSLGIPIMEVNGNEGLLWKDGEQPSSDQSYSSRDSVAGETELAPTEASMRSGRTCYER